MSILLGVIFELPSEFFYDNDIKSIEGIFRNFYEIAIGYLSLRNEVSYVELVYTLYMS